MKPLRELKPNKTSFIYFRFAKQFFSLTIFFLLISSFLFFFSPIALLPLFLIFLTITIYTLINLHVQYKKERYLFFKDKILQHGGSIFSDFTTEVHLPHVTMIRRSKPFVEHLLFKTGHVLIQTAGSASTEIALISVNNTDDLFDYTKYLLHKNGFKLSMDKLVQEDAPDMLGVLLEVGRNFFAIVFTGALFVGGLLSEVNFGSQKSFFFTHRFFFLTLIFIFVISIMVGNIFYFFDLQKRKYFIYKDTILFTEGFLTTHTAIIPIENLSDASLSQNFLERIFGLYDVKLSCQGSESEVLFKNIARGKLMEENIDKLIAKNTNLSRRVEIKNTTTKKITTSTTPLKTRKVHSSFKLSFKRDLVRSLLPLGIAVILLLLTLVPFFFITPFLAPQIFLLALPLAIGFGIYLIPIAIVYSTSIIIKVLATHYQIKEKSMEERFKFLSQKNIEFTNDKITAIIFRKVLFLDDWLHTFSTSFWSIGSNASLAFLNIKDRLHLKKRILEKFGMHKREEPIYVLQSKFSIVEAFKSSIGTSSVLLLGACILLVFSFFYPLLFILLFFIVLISTCLYLYLSYYFTKSTMYFYPTHILFKRGVFIKEEFAAAYEDIKDITTKKYAFSDMGSITFNIAGERLEGDNKNKVWISNGFSIRYIEDLDLQDELIDLIFARRPTKAAIQKMQKHLHTHSYKPKRLLVQKPALPNTFIPALILSLCLVICFAIFTTFLGPQFFIENTFLLFSAGIAFIIAILLLLAYIYLSIRMRSYIIEEFRVLERWGVIYKSQSSIIFNKINFIGKNQGFLNKLFGNGNVTINTIGSSVTELNLQNMKNYVSFYNMLKKVYK